jgi:hypothetical protein
MGLPLKLEKENYAVQPGLSAFPTCRLFLNSAEHAPYCDWPELWDLALN